MQIPTISSSPGREDTGSTGPHADAISFGAGDIDQANQMQIAADRTGQQLEQTYEKENAATAQNAAVQAEVDWTNNLNSAKAGNGPHNTLDFMGSFNDYVDSKATGMNAQAADMFRQSMQTMGVGIYKQSLHIEASNAAKDAVGNANKNYAALQGLVGTNPNTLPDALALVDNGKPALPTNNPSVADASAEAAKTSLVGGAIDGYLLAGVPKAADFTLNNPDYSKYLDPGYAAGKQNEVDVQSKVQTALSKEDLQAQRVANVKSISETGQPVDGYDMMRDAANNAKNPQQAGELYNKLVEVRNGAMLVYQAKTATFGKPPGDAEAALTALKPDPSDPAYASKFHAWQIGVSNYNEQQKTLATDPYTYTLQGSPSIANLQAKASQAFAAGDFQTGSGLQVQAVRQSLAIQSAAGVPAGNLAVVDKATAANLSQQIVSGSQQQGLAALTQIHSMYGPYGDSVFTQMQKLPAETRLPVGYQIVAANLDDSQFANTMLSALRNNEANKAALDGSNSVTNQSLKSGITNNSAFRAYSSALRVSSTDGPQYSDAIGQGILALARSYAQSTGADAAVSKAVTDVVGRSYATGANPNGTHYLIPAKRFDSGDQSDIQGFLSDSLKSLGSTGTMTLGNTKTTVDPTSIVPGANTDTTKQLVLNGIPKNAYWSTLKDGSGVQLLANSPNGLLAGSQGNPVSDTNGQPITVNYGDVKAAKQAKIVAAQTLQKQEDANSPTVGQVNLKAEDLIRHFAHTVNNLTGNVPPANIQPTSPHLSMGGQ